jgi:hypothetical protein
MSLQHIIESGTGQDLDNLGKVLDMPRRTYGSDLVENDAEKDWVYRARLSQHPWVQFALNYLIP